MVLSPKRAFTLQTLLSKTVKPADAEAFCQYAGVQPIGVNFKQNAWLVWEEILKEVLKDQKTSLALLTEIRKVHDLPDIRNFYNEILDGRQARLKTLAQALNKGKCVVFLGPEVLKVRQNNSLVAFNDIMAQELVDRMNKAYIYFDKSLSNNVSYLAQCFTDHPSVQDSEVASIASEKYKKFLEEELVDDDIHEQLAKLPLRLVVNANADDLLCKRLNETTADTCLLKFYDISNSDVEGENLSNGQPPPGPNPSYKVIQYNIFGIFSLPDSILYTESQFLNFVSNVLLGNPKLDSDVNRELQSQENYLFLGFDFDQWYFKVLFEYFKVKKVDYACVSCGFQQPPAAGAPTRGISSYNREFFEQEFKMFFVNDDIKKFLVDLRNTLKAIN
jgi:hypothetical protein